MAKETGLPKAIIVASPGGMVGGGGMGTITRSISVWLRARHPDVPLLVVDTRSDGPGWRWPFRFAAATIQVIAFRLTRGADLLHLQVSERSSFLRKGILLFLGRLFGMRTVLHHHGAELISTYDSAGGVMRWWIRTVSQAADINIVLGERWKTFLVESLKVPATKVEVLYNASPDILAAQSMPRRRCNFLLSANLSPRKGVGEFLAALGELRKTNPEVSATLAGGGDVQRYQREAQELLLTPYVEFTGWIDRQRMIDLMNRADCLVLPSHDEGLPMTILEALSANLPVIATPVGSIPEVLRTEENCILVLPGDIAALTSAMRRVVEDGDLRARLVRNGRALYEKRFDFDAYMAQLTQHYAGVLGRR